MTIYQQLDLCYLFVFLRCQYTVFYFYSKTFLQHGLGCDSEPFLGVGKLGFWASKTSCSGIQIRQTCTPPNSLVRACPQLSSAVEQSCWWGLLLEHQRSELSLYTEPCSYELNPTEYRFPCNSLGAKSEQGRPQSKCTRLTVPPGFPFPPEDLEAQGKPFHVVLHWPGGGAMWSPCSRSFYPSNVSLRHKGLLQPHFHVLGFSQWCPFLEQLLIVPRTERRVRNDLRCHLGDIAPDLFITRKIIVL